MRLAQPLKRRLRRLRAEDDGKDALVEKARHAGAERVLALIDAEPRVVQRDQQLVPRLHSEIKLINLSFNYGRGAAVLHDFNLTIQAGENVARVGHTGAGKSSSAKLIACFYEFQAEQLAAHRWLQHPLGGPGPIPQTTGHRVASAPPVFGHGGRQYSLRPTGDK